MKLLCYYFTHVFSLTFRNQCLLNSCPEIQAYSRFRLAFLHLCVSHICVQNTYLADASLPLNQWFLSNSCSVVCHRTNRGMERQPLLGARQNCILCIQGFPADISRRDSLHNFNTKSLNRHIC